MRKLIAAACALLLATAAHAGLQDTSGAEGKARPDTTTRLLQQYAKDLAAHDYNGALDDLKPVKLDSANKEGRAILSAMRASAYYGLKKDDQARSLVAEAEALAPDLVNPLQSLFYNGLYTDRYDVSADALDKMIAKFPNDVLDIDWEDISFLMRNEPKGQDQRNDDRRLALARIGYGGDTSIGHYRAIEAINILVKRGQIDQAAALLPKANEPEAFENMLVQRRYQALWPKLQEMGGANLAKVRSASVASAEAGLAKAPDDPKKLSEYVDALRGAGRIGDAVALRSKAPSTPADFAAATEDTGWFLNNLGYAFYEAHKEDEGDRLFESLDNPPRTDAGWRISMMINQIELMVGAGRFEKAPPLIEATAKSVVTDGSPYAQQLVRRLRYCVFMSTGKKAEAAKLVPDLMAHAKDALHATVDALLCGGDLDNAEKLVGTALKDPDEDKRQGFEEMFVRSMQPVALTSDDPSVWQGRWTTLRARPAIAAEYARLARDMPAEFLPPKPLLEPTKAP